MKKSLLLPVCLVCIIMVTQAQNKELPPPPPPPKPPAIEKVEFTPPANVEGKDANVAPPHHPLLRRRPQK